MAARPPGLAAADMERPALGGGVERLLVDLRLVRLRQVQFHAEQAHLPPDPDGTGTELVPMIRQQRGVREREARPGSILGKPHLHPAHVAAELPRQRKKRGTLAVRDRASGVPLELVAAADFEVAGDRQKPAGDAGGIRDGVPKILNGGRIAPRERHRPGRLSVAFEGGHRTLYGAELVCNIEVHDVAIN